MPPKPVGMPPKCKSCGVFLVPILMSCAFAVLEFCADKSDGNYAFEKTCAQSYITCVDGSPSITRCPSNTRYSPAEETCLEPIRVTGCEQNADGTLNPCVGRVAGFYAMPGRCDKYVFCANEKPLVLYCEEGLVFDPERSSCWEPSKVHGSCGTLPPRTLLPCCPHVSCETLAFLGPSFDCMGKKAGFHMREGDCRTYFHCGEDGSVSSFACPVNYAFDVEMNMCLPAAEIGGCAPPLADGMLSLFRLCS